MNDNNSLADEMFLRFMIPHHQEAIDMSRKALPEVKRPEVRSLVLSIIQGQEQEIRRMKGLLEAKQSNPGTTAVSVLLDPLGIFRKRGVR